MEPILKEVIETKVVRRKWCIRLQEGLNLLAIYRAIGNIHCDATLVDIEHDDNGILVLWFVREEEQHNEETATWRTLC